MLPFLFLFDSLLHSVDAGVGPFINKTSLQDTTFKDKLEATLLECASFFRSRCLELGVSLLFDRHQRLGLLHPEMLDAVDHKARLRRLITWDDTIGYKFFHTYGPNGTVSKFHVS